MLHAKLAFFDYIVTVDLQIKPKFLPNSINYNILYKQWLI